MNDKLSRIFTCSGLVLGSACGMAGTFVASASLRGLLWGVDGILLLSSAALLVIHHFRKGNDMIAAGFLIYVAGQSLVLATAGMSPADGSALFGAGGALWAAALLLLSTPKVSAAWVRIVGVIAGILFLIVAIQIFMGHALTALSNPLPFNAYPFLVLTLLGWAWQRFRESD